MMALTPPGREDPREGDFRDPVEIEERAQAIARARVVGGRPRQVTISRREAIGLAIHRGLDRWLSPLGVFVFRRTRGGIAKPWKVDALLLTTHGRRSGRSRTVVLQYFPEGDAMLVAAANDGGRPHPGWYFNLVADPRASVEVMGRTIPVVATQLAPDEAARCWRRIVARDPSYERYARATERTIPILRLSPRSSEASTPSP